MTFNTLDLIIFGVVVAACIYGYIRGFVHSLISVFGIFIAFIAAVMYYDDVAPWLQRTIRLNAAFADILAFIGLFVLAKFGLTIVGKILTVIAKAPGIHRLNRWCGALLAFVESCVLIALIVFIMRLFESPNIQTLLNGSWAAGQVVRLFPDLVAATLQFVEHITNK